MFKQRLKSNKKPIAISSVITILSILTIILQPITTPIANAIELNNDNLKLSAIQGPTNGNTTTTITGEQKVFFEGKEIMQVTGGSYYSLALDSDGQVYGWGKNDIGQLGDGTTINRNKPVTIKTNGVLAGKKIVQISAGSSHALALDSNGQVYAWGSNNYGQLGDGTNTNRSEPVVVDTSKKIVQVIGGSAHSIILDSDGQMYAWGYNSYGQLGDGTIINRNKPVAVKTSGALAGKKIVQISAGSSHALALDSNGQVYAWGSNNYGQLGDGTNTNQSEPVLIDTFANKKIIQVAAGAEHSLAIYQNGTVYAWGYNGYGQLGNGTRTNSNTPIPVDASDVLAGKNIVQIAAGTHSLAIDSAGQAYGWGYNYHWHVISGGAYTQDKPVLVNVSGLITDKKIMQIDAGYYNSIALDSNNQVYAWGNNIYGQLGNGTGDGTSYAKTDFNTFLESNRKITSITFDGVEALSFNVVDNNTIEIVTPPHKAGKVDIVITDSEGNTWAIPQGYEYIDNTQPEVPETPAPEIPIEDITVPNTGYKQ